MKKVFAVLAVAGLLVACNNDAGADKETKETPKEVPSTSNPDSPKTMTDPSHNMMPPDSSGTERRPRD
jgi:predicted small secreted protein